MKKATRTTKQKSIIEKELADFKTFFTAEELFHKAQSKDRKIGIATIYRYLKDKSARDAIHSYSCNRRLVYSTQKDNHCHFICTKCGKTTHLDIKNVDFIKKNAPGEICHFQIDLHGICDECTHKNR